MLEFPFNLSGRRKNANREEVFTLVLTWSMDGRSGSAEGILFKTLWKISIDAMPLVTRWEILVIGGGICAPVVNRCVEGRRYYNVYAEAQDGIERGREPRGDPIARSDLTDAVNEWMEEMSSRRSSLRMTRRMVRDPSSAQRCGGRRERYYDIQWDATGCVVVLSMSRTTRLFRTEGVSYRKKLTSKFG